MGPRMVSFSRARRRAPHRTQSPLAFNLRRPVLVLALLAVLLALLRPRLGLPTSPRAREGRGGPRGAKGPKGALKPHQALIERPPHPPKPSLVPLRPRKEDFVRLSDV